MLIYGVVRSKCYRFFFLQKDMAHFDGCLEAIDQNSSNAKVFVLIHKMDLVPEDQRERVRCDCKLGV